MPENVYYHATLAVNAPLIVSQDKKRGGVKVSLGGMGERPLPLMVKRKLAALIEAELPEGEYSMILWPRTDKEGLLGSGTQLAVYKPVGQLERELGLHALGELVKVDRENALIQIQISPNAGQGSLKKSFKLPLVASIEILDSLPELGTGLEVWADLKQKTGRVVITKIQAVPLPPKQATEESIKQNEVATSSIDPQPT